MKTSSLLLGLEYNDSKPAITVLMETETSKEIRIAMKNGQLMKEHQTPYPITVELFEGTLEFGVEGKILTLVKGDLISLEGGVAHDLIATSNSIIRLTLSKLDKVERVKEVAQA